RELVDARAAYEKAKTGQAAQLKPEVVHEAKVSLDQAEAAFNDDATSDRTRDLSYVAERKAELAMAQASQAGGVAQKDQAARDLLSLQAAGLQKAQGELSATKQQLAAAGEKLQLTGAALEQERKAAPDTREQRSRA